MSHYIRINICVSLLFLVIDLPLQPSSYPKEPFFLNSDPTLLFPLLPHLPFSFSLTPPGSLTRTVVGPLSVLSRVLSHRGSKKL